MFFNIPFESYEVNISNPDSVLYQNFIHNVVYFFDIVIGFGNEMKQCL